VTRDLFEAFLAAKDLLTEANRKPTDEPSGDEFIVRILGEESQPEPLRAIALRSLRPDHPALGTDRLRRMVEGGGAGLRLEAIRTLAARSDVASQDVLRTVATNARFDSAIRAEAVLGLAHSAATSADTAQLLSAMLDGTDAGLRREALRSLRAAVVRLEVTAAVRTWLKKSVGSADADEIEQAELLLRTQAEAISHGGSAEVKERFAAAATGAGDTAEGQRVFFHPNGPQCFACHRVNGRGGAVGPDLSVIGRTLDREKIVRSILEPSKDIAPQFTPWAFALRDGRVVTGIILQDDPRGVITLGDTQGRTIEVNVSDIDERKAQDRSIMPDNIADRMTPGEFRDLVSYLMELK
jgi:putative heme-binding domain-containing protein